ncbi:TIGR01777 family oxidoreductase [Reichenbachiella sp.]|uniref:TIGR01777 family oxidoreductase n=1 Tax=Reichenbachiella sp. TaxID=2184521 RepID=UPI003BAFF469
MKKVVLAGGTGFLGKLLRDHFVDKDYQVVILSRQAYTSKLNITYVPWDGETLSEWKNELEGADALINLCGKSVDCRYTESNKKLIYDTRLNSTQVLGKAVGLCKTPPKVWINSSSATIYRHAEDRDMGEETGEIGTGFSVDVCKKWENAFFDCTSPGTRKVALRIAIVIGKNGGALQPLKSLTKIGFGGRQGSGNQYFSWIHEVDFINAVNFVLDNKELSGVCNVSSPNPVRNTQFMSSLRKALKVPFGIPMPKWMLEMGALIIRTETELILKSRRVVPKKLIESGYRFHYGNLENALIDLVQKKP